MKTRLVVFIALLASVSSVAAGQTDPEDCALVFQGTARKLVKLRAPSVGTGYQDLGHGEALAPSDLFGMTCDFDAKIPKKVPATKPIVGLEDRLVTIDGYLVGARFERATPTSKGKDNDLHLEIADTADWNQDHLIVEVPPGQDFCDARKAIWDMVLADEKASGKKSKSDAWLFETPPHVQVTGFIFLDTAHLHAGDIPCETNCGRGLRKKGGTSKVKGLWELHPVTDVLTVE
jgi:hypothetical protein